MSAGNATVGSRPDPSAAGGGAARRAFRLSFAGLLTTMAVASLDQNIVSTALPRIVGELAHLPWVITAFMLTATATTPLYGKLSDTDPRRILLMTFSRRAAAEMTRRVERIARQVMGSSAGVMTEALTWAGTFHGIGARLLREYADQIGIAPAFTIHDREDSADLMNSA